MSHDATEHRSFTFGVFTADTARGAVLHGGDTIPLTARAYQVLLVLLEARGRTVSKDELLKAVWQGVFIEENNLARQISTLRKVFHQFDPDAEYLRKRRLFAWTGYVKEFFTSIRKDHSRNIPAGKKIIWSRSQRS